MPERRERLAINLYDLSRLEPTIRTMLLGGRLDLSRESVVRVDLERPDETAVPFTCPLEQAAACCDVIRGHDRRSGEPPTRVYLNRLGNGSWERISGGAILVINGRLNIELFRPEAKVAPVEEAKPVKLF